MEHLEADFYYSTREHIAFYIAGYFDTGDHVTRTVKFLKEQAKLLVDNVPESKVGNVKSMLISGSRKYEGRRVFFLEEIHACPPDAFPIGEKRHWTMAKWLHE